MSETERITNTEPATQDNEVVDFAAALKTCDEEANLSQFDREIHRLVDEWNERLERGSKLPPFDDYAGKWMTKAEYEDEWEKASRGERSLPKEFEEAWMPRAEFEAALMRYESPESQMDFGRLVLQNFYKPDRIIFDLRTHKFSTIPPEPIEFPYPVLLVDYGPWDELFHELKDITVNPDKWTDDSYVRSCLKGYSVPYDRCIVVHSLE